MNTIIELLASQARTRPGAPAVIADHLTLDWASLYEAACRMSSMLRIDGVGPGDHVALLCSNCPAFIVTWFGIASCGAVTVSLNTGLVGEGLRYSIEQSDARTVVIERSLWKNKQADLAPALAGRSVIMFDNDAELLGRLRAFDPAQPYPGCDSDPCTLIYTSGTTGRPKGVVNSHRAYIACGLQSAQLLGLEADDRIMVVLPLFHTNPQMYAVMSALTVGCSVVIRPRFSVSGFFRDAQKFGCTVFTYVGTVLTMLVSGTTGDQGDHSLRTCIGGGAPVDVWKKMIDRFGIQVQELYGMTEIGGWVTGNRLGHIRVGSCGQVRPDVEVGIFDENDKPLPPGGRGEIVVRPKQPSILLNGYYKNPSASWASARNFWFHTGDSGSLDDDGYLYFHGRMNELIRRGGENISPIEIETALIEHPELLEAFVVGVPDAIYGEEIKVVLVPRYAEFDPRSIREFLSGRVPDFMLPRYVQFTSAVPKTETQKVQRKALVNLAGPVIDLNEGTK